MEIFATFSATLLHQFQQPTLAFLVGGMALAALGSKFEIPAPVYKFIVILLLLKVGLSAGISVRDANIAELAVPALLAMACGVAIVLLGTITLAKWHNVDRMDAMATAGLFGAVSASSLAAGMAMLDAKNIAYEGFIGALYPFMDVAALVTAIILAKLAEARAATLSPAAITSGTATLGNRAKNVAGADREMIQAIIVDAIRSPAISALLLGLTLGIFAEPDAIYESFYQPLFKGLLSILMLIMGMEAWSRLSEMRKVAHAYILYGIAAPLVHGSIGFAAGILAHEMTGFSLGGVVLMAVMAASSSDISGPPTLRGAIPRANPSAYVGTSTGIGTPVAILSIPLWISLAELIVG
ncbi:MAG: sodium-dependent bicarbonate transport family permease [Pseudomonadota bacterium]